MKKQILRHIATLLFFSFFINVTFINGQSPYQFKYQAALRNADGQILSNEYVMVKISILSASIDGPVEFVESHSVTTNAYGVISIVVGSINDLSNVDWSADEYFIKTTVNGVEMGTSQLVSVPFALMSKQSEDFKKSVAAGISDTDTTFWNNKSEFDGDFSSLYNAPNIANTTNNKQIQLNTNDANSSLEISKANGTSVFKVDGNGRLTGDGSGFSNVKPLINYIGGYQRIQITANYGSFNNVRTVSLTVPSNGVCFVTASGFVDWESTGWDLYLGAILCDQDPNSSWAAENEWWDYLNLITDYNCPDSTDQYTSFSQHRCIPVSAGTHSFTLWVNKYSSASLTEVRNVNLSVMFFPTGGTGKSADDAIKEEEIIVPSFKKRSVSGHD